MKMGNKIRILHAADLHLDSPFEGLDEEKAALRRAEQRETLHKIAEYSAMAKADLVLLAGDLLDGEGIYRETGETLRAALGEISAPVFIAPGNHDPYTPGCVYETLALPENVHVFKSRKLECAELPGLGVRVWGAAFTDRFEQGMLRGFEAEKRDGMLDIMVIHGDAGAQKSVYNPISEEDIRRSGMDYIALGHVHAYSGLCRAGDTYFAYPGCAEGRGFDECGEKGVIIAEVTEEGTQARFIPVCSRRYETLDVDLSNVPEGTDALDALEAVLPGDTENDIYRITFTGSAAEAPDLRSIQSRLEGRFFSLRLRDRTSIRRDLWEKCGEDTLRGLFLTKLRLLYDAAATDEEREKITLAARYGLMSLENGEGPAM